MAASSPTAAAHDGLPVDARARLGDDMTEVLEHAGGAHGRGGDLGVDRRARPGSVVTATRSVPGST